SRPRSSTTWCGSKTGTGGKARAKPDTPVLRFAHANGDGRSGRGADRLVPADAALHRAFGARRPATHALGPSPLRPARAEPATVAAGAAAAISRGAPRARVWGAPAT